MSETYHRRRDDVPQTKMRRLMRSKITVAWALAVLSFVVLAVGLIGYSVKQNFSADTERDEQVAYAACVASNQRRADAKVVALADVQRDREIWRAIDKLFDDGIPEPARSTIFDGLVAQETVIGETYVPVDCPIPKSLAATIPPVTT